MRVMKMEAAGGSTEIMLGESLDNLKSYCGGAEKTVIITDSNVRRHHGGSLKGFEIIEIGLGEGEKTLSTVEKIYERFLELELDRSSFVVGVGGGIVCDVAGFAASTYLRGLPFGFVPTTLLAQVDASVGGKNGVNFRGYKNIIGLIRQPKFCLCDFSLLRTLPEREMRCGFAEAVKHGAIGDAALLSYLEGNWSNAFTLNRTAIEKVVHDSLAVKIGIVSKDESERGERMKLNFGHTLAHAIEKTTGIAHGEAVSIGMVAAAELSVRKGSLKREDAKRLEALLHSIGLPTRIDADTKRIVEAMRKDKKRYGEKLRVVLLDGLGKARIAESVLDELEGILG